MSRIGASTGLLLSTAVACLAAACSSSSISAHRVAAVATPLNACSLFPAVDASRIAHAPTTVSLMVNPLLGQPGKYRCVYSTAPGAEVAWLGIETFASAGSVTDREFYNQLAKEYAADGEGPVSSVQIGERTLFHFGVSLHEISLLQVLVHGGVFLVGIEDLVPHPSLAAFTSRTYEDRVLGELEATARIVLVKTRNGKTFPQ